MRKSNFTLLAALVLAGSLLAGCGKGDQPAALNIPAPEQTKAGLQASFKDAKPEVQAFANDAVAAMQANDNPKAFMQLNALAANSALTEQQRQAASTSMIAVGQKLRESAAKGDAEAAKALELYDSTK